MHWNETHGNIVEILEKKLVNELSDVNDGIYMEKYIWENMHLE